jgi:hypothetical protein
VNDTNAWYGFAGSIASPDGYRFGCEAVSIRKKTTSAGFAALALSVTKRRPPEVPAHSVWSFDGARSIADTQLFAAVAFVFPPP